MTESLDSWIGGRTVLTMIVSPITTPSTSVSIATRTQAVTDGARPIAEQWRARREGLLELREAYRAAMGEIERVLTDEQFAEAMRPMTATKVSGRSRGMVRCLFRSHLAIVS